MNFLGAKYLCLSLVLTLTACAAVQHSPARIRVLAQEARITLDTGYTRTLKAGGR
jgi:hypothetical protein